MNLLLEIGCEELPTSAIDIATAFLPKQLQTELEAARLTVGTIEAFGTPRRLLLLAQNLAPQQSDLDLEVQGPKAEVAFDAQGNLTPAGLGFLKARNINPQHAFTQETPKGKVLAAKMHESGRSTAAVLQELLPKLILQIPFAKTMHWESSKTRFARPIRWILCLLDTQVVSFQVADVTSSNQTCGHRFLGTQFQEVTQNTYFDFLEKNWVMFDKQKRQAAILSQAQKLAQAVGGQLREDPELLSTVANLVEYPWPILGNFDSEYLKIPQEILICEMREHQKYFAILRPDGELLPHFVVISGSKPVNETALAAGNARVLKARFEDGAFYFQEDLKKKLQDYVGQSQNALIEWARRLAERLQVQDSSNLERAAFLCKADLNTGVVGQFPELQGIMGGIYAKHSGEPPEVIRAIHEHYLPKFSGDKTPESLLGAILSLADRLTTLNTRKLPKGSADPYGLRRAAIGLTRIILAHRFKLDLRELIGHEEILEFVMTRAKGVFLESAPVLLVEATQAAAGHDLCAWQARIQALEQFDYSAVSAVFKRVSNLVTKAEFSHYPADFGLLKEPSEQALLQAVQAIHPSENHAQTLAELATLKPILDEFFEKIMVMVEDAQMRHARLTLLSQVQKKAAHVADFSKLSA